AWALLRRILLIFRRPVRVLVPGDSHLLLVDLNLELALREAGAAPDGDPFIGRVYGSGQVRIALLEHGHQSHREIPGVEIGWIVLLLLCRGRITDPARPPLLGAKRLHHGVVP